MDTTLSEMGTASPPKSRLLSFIAARYLTFMTPFLLVIISVRFVMTPLFLQFEYNRPGFPADIYGFTTQERLQYAPFAVEYLMNGEGIDFLSNLDFPDGTAMYNARELRHMHDVKIVTQYVFIAAIALGVCALGAAYTLWRTNRHRLRSALFQGSVFTFGLIAAIVLIAILNWDTFFTGFHQLFFTSGTWRFEYSDTLIRLFPEQFWFDAALLIGGLTVLGAGLILVLTWRWKPNHDV